MTIDPVLYRGKPENGRIPKEARCYELLDALGMEYCRADHDFADTIDACHEVEKVLGCEICKNLLLTNRQMTEVYLLLKLSRAVRTSFSRRRYIRSLRFAQSQCVSIPQSQSLACESPAA